MAETEAVLLCYLISSRPSICINFFGQTVHTYQHIGYVIAQILTTADANTRILKYCCQYLRTQAKLKNM